MRINQERKTLDIEPRDWNYIMPAFVRNYLFHTHNEAPVEIVFPMFKAVVNPATGEDIPVRWVEEGSEEAVEIKVDGSNIKEASEEDIAAKDKADEVREEVKLQVSTPPRPPAKVKPPAARPPRLPANPLPPGTPLDGMQPRQEDADLKAAKRDLAEQPDVSDEEGKVDSSIITRDSSGKPKVG